jgi:hypothetical protein
MNCSNDSSNRDFPEAKSRIILGKIIITLCFTWLILDDNNSTVVAASGLWHSLHASVLVGAECTDFHQPVTAGIEPRQGGTGWRPTCQPHGNTTIQRISIPRRRLALGQHWVFILVRHASVALLFLWLSFVVHLLSVGWAKLLLSRYCISIFVVFLPLNKIHTHACSWKKNNSTDARGKEAFEHSFG